MVGQMKKINDAVPRKEMGKPEERWNFSHQRGHLGAQIDQSGVSEESPPAPAPTRRSNHARGGYQTARPVDR